ncbi:MAG: discoidin domain-containing protein [Phycisphaeraceae bacterium]
MIRLTALTKTFARPFRSLTPRCGLMALLLLALAGPGAAQQTSPTQAAEAPEPTVETPLPTPGMGWATFNFFIAMHNEDVFHQLAEAFEASGLRDAGYDILRIDGGWWGYDGGERHYYWTEAGEYEDGTPYKPGDPHVDPADYPHGLKALAEHLHERGFKFGFYLDPNISMGVAGNYPNNEEEEVPPPVTGADLVRQHAAFVAENQIDHLFFDGYAWSPSEKGDEPYAVMYEELRRHAEEQGRPIIVSTNGWSGREYADEWRTGPDIDYPWDLILQCIGTAADPGEAGHGRWANPDYLMVGFIDDEEARSQMSLWCVAGAPLYLSHDHRVLNEWDRYVLLNTEAIAVNQDLGGEPGRRIRNENGQQVWARPLADGSTAVVLLNAGDEPASVSITWEELDLPEGPVQIRDLWAHENLEASEDGYTAEDLPGRGVAFLKLMPGDEPLPEPEPTWAEHPGEKPDFTPIEPGEGWRYSTSMPRDAEALAALFDHDPDTHFASPTSPDDYIEIAFDEPTTLDRIVIDTPGHKKPAGPNPWPYEVYAQRSTYAVEVSEDGENFESLVEDSLGPRYTIASFDPVSVQAVRIVIRERQQTSVYDDSYWDAHDIYLFNTEASSP